MESDKTSLNKNRKWTFQFYYNQYMLHATIAGIHDI